MTVLINLIGGVALLIWGVRMVRTAVTRGFGADLRRLVAAATERRIAAFSAGIGVTTLLQSSTATALLVASFASRGSISSALALAILLGADVGTTIVVQIFSQRIGWLSPLLTLIGVVVFLMSERTPPRNIGRACIGLGLVLLALQLIGEAARTFADSEALRVVVAHLGNEPLLTVLLLAGITLLLHSSVVVVLLLAALASADLILLEHAAVMVLGANLGGALLPVIATYPMGASARVAPVANAGVRVAGVVAFLGFAPWIAAQLSLTGLSSALLVAQFHTLFNVVVALAALPFVEQIARFTESVLSKSVQSESDTVVSNLDEQAYETPVVALACATREALRIGDVIKRMLDGSMDAIRTNDPVKRKNVEALDDEVDRLYEAIKLYLARLTKEELDSEESARSIEILSFTTNLEHVGDIVDKNLMELAAKKARSKIAFSDVGMSEIEALHADVLVSMELALNVFISGDLELARKLIARKIEIRDMERHSTEMHFARISEGRPQSIDSSSLHLDVLRDLKRIHSHLTAVAYPILERANELADSRLKRREPSDMRMTATPPSDATLQAAQKSKDD
ncbi:MAG: Na/Pi cotransporter family protein [Hyphomicrobiaceae bacterium]